MKKWVFAVVLISISGFSFSCSNQATSFGLPSAQQSFGQVITYNNKVDILFMVDNSKSMTQYQQRLSAKIPDMISTLNSLKMDYHVAVTSSTMTTNLATYPMSRQLLGSPKFLTRENIDLLSGRLLVGEAGSDLNRGLDAIAFVTGPYAANFAPGYLRSDALFVVVMLGDEDDRSSEFGTADSNDFVNYMNKIKPPFADGSRAWIANLIGTTQGQTCDNLGGYLAIGVNYLRLVTSSNGIKESICSGDLSLAVSNIKARIIDQLTRFKLKSAPIKTSIRVTISGRTITEGSVDGWTLENEMVGTRTNYFIQFHGAAIPAADEAVNVDFTLAGAT